MTSSPALEAELLRTVLSVTAHDLGGLASALALRADVIERTAASDSSAALRRIADELRTLGYDVRAFRSAEGGDVLSPARSGSLSGWLTRVQRFGRPMLPRGSTLEGSVPEVMLAPAAALELTYVTLAVLQQIASRCAQQGVTVRIDAHTDNQCVVVVIDARVGDGPLPMPGDATADWWQWALARAAGSDIAMRAHDGRVQLEAPVLPPS